MTSFKRFGLLFITLLLGIVTYSQPATIEGSAPHWAGKEVGLKICIDYITNTFETTAQTTIAADGSFSLQYEPTHTTTAWIGINRWTAPIYIEPGKTYQIDVLETKESVLIDAWQKGAFDYDFIDLPKGDLNENLSQFDSQYFDFYLDNVQYIGTSRMKKLVSEFALQHQDTTWSSFESAYKNYAIAEMKLSAGIRRDHVFDQYLSDTTRYYSSEAWYRLFNIFFADYFQTFDNKFGGMSISNRMRKNISADSLDVLLQADDFVQSKYTRQLVMLNAIAEVQGSNAYRTSELLKLTDWIEKHATNNTVDAISEHLKEKLNGNKGATSLAYITSDWTPRPTIDTTGEKYTLLMVSDPDNKEAQKETLVLRSLVEKYGDIFEVIELDVTHTDRDIQTSWARYNTAAVGPFLDAHQIYGIPHFMWFDPQGKRVEANLEKPSMGLESRLYKIKSDRKESQRIKVGSK